MGYPAGLVHHIIVYLIDRMIPRHQYHARPKVIRVPFTLGLQIVKHPMAQGFHRGRAISSRRNDNAARELNLIGRVDRLATVSDGTEKAIPLANFLAVLSGRGQPHIFPQDVQLAVFPGGASSDGRSEFLNLRSTLDNGKCLLEITAEYYQLSTKWEES